MTRPSEKRNPPVRPAGFEGAQAGGRERSQGTTTHHGLRQVADILPELLEELFQRHVAGRQA